MGKGVIGARCQESGERCDWSKVSGKWGKV